MFSQYFGQYLLNHGFLSPEQLYHALEAQQAAHVKLGVLAMSEGFLTASQVEEIHQEQTRRDQRFGEIALAKGYLTQEQLDSLLASQRKGHLLLGQALIDAKILNLNQLGRALKEYQEEHSLSDEQFSAVQGGDFSLLLRKTLNLDDQDQVLNDYLSLFAKNIIRFISSQAWLTRCVNNETAVGDWSVVQQISGSPSLTTAIAGSQQSILKLASLFAKEEIKDMDELAQASVAEFLNLHNGLFLVNMSNQGTELKLEPQVINKAGFVTNQNCQVFEVNMVQDKFSLIIEMKG